MNKWDLLKIACFFSRSRDDVKNELDDLVKHMVDEFYQPAVNNMKPRTT